MIAFLLVVIAFILLAFCISYVKHKIRMREIFKVLDECDEIVRGMKK